MPAKQTQPMIVRPSLPTAKAVADRFTGDVWVGGITDGAGSGTATLAAVQAAVTDGENARSTQ